jgi:hypothetical protein
MTLWVCQLKDSYQEARIRPPEGPVCAHRAPIHVTAALAVASVITACAMGPSPAHPDPGMALQDEVPTGFPRTCDPAAVQVMLLGTYHFQGSARDAVSGEPQDMLSPRRQAELDDLVARLAQWAPQQVAVEWPASFADSTHARYRRYLDRDGASASQNEVVQVGFRLARHLGLATVHPIDHQMPIGNDSLAALIERRPDLEANADRLLRQLQEQARAADSAMETLTVVEQLRLVNREERLRGGNSFGMFGSWLAAGEGANLGGPQLLTRWYERNFYMAHYLTRVLEPDTRRVLVLVGSGHVPPLRNILDEAPQLCPVSPLPYLR